MRKALILLACSLLATIACGARATAPERALLCPGVVDTVRVRIGDSTYIELVRKCGLPVPAAARRIP